MKNFLVIGVGPHARLNHLPKMWSARSEGLVGAVVGVDLTSAADDIAAFQSAPGNAELPMSFIEPFDASAGTLPGPVRETLDRLVREHTIDAVVVSTEPSFHTVYTHWALEHGLSVLLDKPLSVRADCSVDPFRASAILSDFDAVLDSYAAARREHPEVIVAVQCQRRHHPAFLAMREMIAEVAAETGCPVTSVQSFHSDGQWRMPNELIDISYHSFEQGYGKCAHSGYHFFDIVPWLLRAGERPGKELDSVEIHASFSRPHDFLAQLRVEDYARIFPEFESDNPYSQSQLHSATEAFGEIDAFVSMAYKSAGRVMTLGSINLVHNGFSQRGHSRPVRANLYKGNGRVRHESHIIEQGPFQAIHFHSLQTLGDPAGASPERHDLGGQNHIEVHVFRNSNFNSRWTTLTTLDYEALSRWRQAGAEEGDERPGSTEETREPTQSASRRRAMQEFLEYVNGRRTREQMSSEISDHRRSATLMAGTYLSAAEQWVGGAPVAKLDFRTTSGAPAVVGGTLDATGIRDLLDLPL